MPATTARGRHRDRPGLSRIARACWIPNEQVDDLAGRCAAALESSAGYTVVASTTAARLHGFWLPDLPDALHLATAQPAVASRSMTRTRRPEFCAHRRQLPDEDLTAKHGLVLTTPARTWRDLAGVLDLPSLVAAGDSVLRAGTSVEELTAVINRTTRCRHVRAARIALALLDGRSRSRPESHLRVAVSAPDLPRFEVNVAISRSTGGWLAEPDLSLQPAKLALEYQGADHAEIKRMRRDITRNADLRREGWLCCLYGPAEVFGRPWEIKAEVRALLTRRAPALVRRHRPRVVTYASSGHL
jgi:hypothetical protein